MEAVESEMGMTFTFRPGARENVSVLLALAGASGSGKTFSAMRLASGIVGVGKRFAVIDTEARRALHYADRFAFDHGELKAPFRPQAYTDAIKAADEAGYGAIVIDSMSLEWSGEGGILDWQDEELDAMVKRAKEREHENRNEWQLRESMKMAAWIKPKMGHKAMVQRLLQSRAHVIFCLRAEEKVEIVRDGAKTKIVPKGYQPICAKDFMFEQTASFLLLPEAPGIGKAIKLQEQHRALFPNGQQIDEEAGKRLAEWARGGKPTEPQPRDWPKFGTTMTERVNSIEDVIKLDSLIAHNAAHLQGYMEWSADKYQDLMALVAARKTELLNREAT